MNKTKWTKIMGIAMGLPSLVFALGYIFMMSVEKNILSKTSATIIFIFLLINPLILMIAYAVKNKS